MHCKKGKLLATFIITMLVLVIIPFSASSLSATGVSDECYGFIISVDQHQSTELQMEISKLVNELLRNEVEVYWVTNQIYVSSKTLDENSSIANNYFEKGSYLIPFVDNQSINEKATNIAYSYNAPTYILKQPIDNLQVYKLVEPKIAYHNGPWMITHMYFTPLIKGGFETYDFLSWDEIPEKLNSEEYNVFIWGASYGSIERLYNDFFERFKYPKAFQTIRNFVADGGSFVGSCAASTQTMLGSRLPIYKLKPYFPEIQSRLTLSFTECKFMHGKQGIGKITVEIIDTECPISYGLPKYVTTYYSGAGLFLKPKDNTKIVAVMKEMYEDETDSKNIGFKDLLEQFSIGKGVWATTDFGDGRVIAFSDHPEWAQYNFTYPWGYEQMGNNSRIAYNSIFYACSNGPINVNINTNASLYEPAISQIEESSNVNSPPNKPKLNVFKSIFKSRIVRPNTKVLVYAQTDDPDDDLFFYKIWTDDDSELNNYTCRNLFFASGQNMAFNHIYNKTGRYYMKVKVIDIHGTESEWSDPLEIIVTKTPFISRIFNR